MTKTHNCSTAQYDNNENNAPKAISSAFIRQLTKRTLKYLPPTFAAIGFLLILVYCMQIGYMPIFDLSTLTTVLVSVAFAALSLTFLFVLVLLLPGVYWRIITGESEQLKTIMAIPDFFSRTRSIAPFFVIPSITWFCVIFWFASKNVVFLPFAVLSALLFIVFLLHSKEYAFFKDWFKFNLSGAFTAFAFLFPTLLINDKFAGTAPVYKDTFTYVYLLLVAFINVIVIGATTDKDSLKKAVVIALGGVVLVAIGTGMLAEIPRKTMALYKLGNIESATLHLKKDVCNVFSTIDTPRKTEKSCVLENVEILSRLGTEYFVNVDGREAVIPSHYVIQWYSKPKIKEVANTTK